MNFISSLLGNLNYGTILFPNAVGEHGDSRTFRVCRHPCRLSCCQWIS